MACGTQRARGTYRATKGFKPDPAAAAAPKATASRYYQLKTGHAAIGTYLHKVKAQEDQACQWCQAPYERVNHYCSNVENGGRSQGDLIRARVQYPTDTEDAPEGRLFGDQKATKALLNFIATTEVGMGRGEGIREAERTRRDDEWWERVNQQGRTKPCTTRTTKKGKKPKQ
jgi:hypothetical protein